MIPVSLKQFRAPNTRLFLNGPTITIVDQPQSIVVGVGTTVTFSGFATVAYTDNPTAVVEGTVAYQWYDADTDQPLVEGTKYVGTATSQLTINNTQSPEDQPTNVYFEADFIPAAQVSGNLNNPTSGNTI